MRSALSFATSLAIASYLASPVLAYEYNVGVGKDEVTGNVIGYGFDPSRISVQQDPAGDDVVFEMLSGTHRVVSSSFSAPCAAGGVGFDTQEVTVPEGTESGGQRFIFNMTQYNTPLYFSDIGSNNCQSGAIFCINTDEASAESCAAFRDLAIALGGGRPINQTSSSAVSSAASTAASSGVSSVSSAASSAASSATSVMSSVSSRASSATSAASSAAAAAISQPASGANKLAGGAVAGAMALVGALLAM